MVPEHLILFICLVHFLADFGLQTSEQATLKSTNSLMLFYHVGVYSIIWALFSIILFDGTTHHLLRCLYFSIITFVTHFGTDYVTSRLSKKFFDNQDYHNGFVVIGFDQLVHILTLWYTIKYFL